MTVQIQFDIDNAIFTDGETYDISEVVRTVQKIAGSIEDNAKENGPHILAKCETIMDANGDKIGYWCIKERELL